MNYKRKKADKKKIHRRENAETSWGWKKAFKIDYRLQKEFIINTKQMTIDETENVEAVEDVMVEGTAETTEEVVEGEVVEGEVEE